MKTTLLSFTSQANEAFTLLALARTQKPGSTASVTLAGNELSVCLVAYEDNYIKLLWSNRNILVAKTLEISDFGDGTLIILFLCRILGLCLLQNELCPITLNRHVIKVLLGRKVRTFLHTRAFSYVMSMPFRRKFTSFFCRR